MAANQIGLNQIFPIYNENGTSFHDLVLRKGVVDSIVMSLGDKITGDVFYKDNTLQVTMKEYVEYNGIHFSLVNPPTIVREGMVADNGELKGMTKYSFEFYHPMYQLSNFPFTDVATKTGEEKYLSQNKTFSWIGKPQDYIDKLNKNLQGTVWYVRKSDRFPVEKDDELSDVQQFDNVSVAEAIKRGYEIWGIPYIVSQLPSTDTLYAQGKRFVVEYGLPSNEIYESESARQLDTPFVFQMGHGVGLKNNSRTPRNNKIVTRIAGYGSEDNVPYGYPQIVWTGNQDWDYTINNDPDNPLSYPIYKGIVGGQYVKLIKHPFTRTHLMPSIFTETVNKKVNPNAVGYDPTIEIKDYYDAIATQEYPYINEINLQAPSYESHEFADIKPELDADRNIGIVSAVPLNADLTPADHWDDSMDDDGNYLQSYFQITLPRLSFDLYACAAITQEMEINMRSGACIGCTFPVQVDWDDYKRNFYDEDGNFVPDGEQRDLTKYPKSNLGQISVVVQKDNSTFGTLMPNIYQQPQANDLFVFIGISLPLSYIANAEERLDDAMKTYMLENNVYYFDYPLKFDEHFLATHTYILEQIRPNSIIHFDYGGVEQQLFVKQLTVKYGNAPLPQYDITLTDNVDVVLNQIGQVADDVDRLSTLISILRQSYSRNVWNELAKKLSKVDDDTAKGWITILKGVRTLSDFIELSEGGAFYTDENTLAHLTADVARIRERILGTLRVGDTTASVQTEPTLHVGGDARIDDNLDVHEDLNVGHDAVIGEILTALNHIYTNLLTSDNFTDDSAFGTGFSLSKKKNNENRSYLVVDELFVRWKAIFNELEIRRISYTGGNRVSSHAASKIVKVKDIVRKLSYTVAGTVLTLSGQVNVVGQTLNIDGGVTVNGTTATITSNSVTYAKRCYAMKDDGTTATMNWWKVNDQARCQTFNVVESGNYQSARNKSYWRRVLEVGYEKIEIDGALSEEMYDYVDLSVADCMTGSDLPEEGDTIVQMGNRTDTSRQGFIISDVAGESAPDIQIFRNVNSYTLEGKRKIILSPDETHLRVNSIVIETEYDAQRVPMERGDWEAIPEHKCYYYDLVQYNGSSWLCIFPESGTGGVKYTTEPPSETSIYWQIYAQKGADGKDGKDGKSFNILGSYDTEEELIEAHPTGQVGDAYIVAGYLYVWDEENDEWHNSGQIKGDTGRGISSVTISYGKSNSSTTIPSTWYSSVDAVGLQAGDYLFTRMVYNYTDGEPAQSEPVYSIGYIGRDGSNPVVGDIDNEVISVACDKDGKVLAEFNKTISVKMYDGSTPVTLKNNGLTVSSASGITIDQVSAANGTFRVHIPQNNTISQANNFTVTATANIGGTDVSRVMSFVVNGVRQGADGTPSTIYELLTSLSSIKKDKDGTPDVNTITATKQKTVGNVTSETTDGTLKYKIDGGSEQTYSSAIQTSSISTGIEFIYYIGNVIVDRETVPVIMDGQDGTNGLPSAYLNLSDSVVDIEVDENGKATNDFYEEVTYTMGAYGKFLYIKSVSVSSSSHVIIPAYILSPLANGLITVSGTTATLTKDGVTVQGTIATLPYGYTAIPRIEVKAQDGDTINEGTVTVNGVAIDTDGNEYTAMNIFKVARQYYAPALQLVLSQDTLILTQSEAGHKDIDLTNAYTDVALRIGGTDITTDLYIATEVSQFYDEEDEHYINSCNVSVVGNRVRITAIGSYSYIPSGSTDEKIVYCETGYVDITVTYRGVPYTKRWQFYCNLLGSWKETVEADTKTAIAQSTLYEFTGDSEVSHTEKLGEFIASSKKYETKLTSTVLDANGNVVKTSGSLYQQTSDSISMSVKTGLQSTGIDIDNGTIKLQANKVTFCDSSGGNTDKIWIDNNDGTLHAVNGVFSGSLYLPFTIITRDNYEQYADWWNPSDHTQPFDIDFSKTGLNAQINYAWIDDNPGHYLSFDMRLPYPFLTDFYGAELQIFNARTSSLTVHRQTKGNTSQDTEIPAKSIYTFKLVDISHLLSSGQRYKSIVEHDFDYKGVHYGYGVYYHPLCWVVTDKITISD